nr:hypothetical protein [Tanacetum cinerariifolium]
MDQQYPIVAKIPVLDTGKFEQWQFWIQKYLQHEHYALWEVIEFGDSYVVTASPSSTTTTDTTSDESGKKSGRTVTLTAEDMQKKKNDFMDVEIKQDDLNQKFLTSLAPEWLMHIIVWRNMGDLNTMSLDDLYNHLKVCESEVQKKSEPNSQNMAFISSAKHSSGNKDGNTACVPTASTNVPTASATVATISQDTACAYIASQSSGSQIKFEDINQIDENDMEEIDIKWNMALLSMRADKAPRSQERRKRDNYKQWSKAEEQAPKALMAIDRVGWDWSYMTNNEEDHELVADEVAPIEFSLMANTSAESKKLETLKEEKEGVDGKLAGLLTASKDLDNLIESQRSDTKKEGLGYSTVPPLPAQLYLPPKKDLSWSGLPECADDTGSSQNNIDDKGYWDSGCSRHMTGNISYLFDFEPFDEGYVSFGQGGCKITGKGTIKTSKLEFESVYFVKDLKGLPTKCFENDHTCTACLKGKQHKASLTDDFSRFTWTFFLKSKDETSGIFKKFITEIENLKDLKVKIIRVLVNKSHNKTPYELFNGISHAIGFLKPFGCHVMILNTLDNLGKFEEKWDEVDAGTISTNLLGTKDATGQEVKKDASSLRYIALPNWTHDALLEFSLSKPQDHCSTKVPEGSGNPNPTASTSNPPANQMETLTVETPIPTVSLPVLTAYSTEFQEPSSDARLISKSVANQVETPSLDNILSLTNQFEDILRTLVDCPKEVRPIGTKLVLKNKKDERGIVIRNKARLVAQGHTQEEGIDNDEVFAPVARIEAIRLFLADALFMGFKVYQMDVKSSFLYGTIVEEVGTIDQTLFIRRKRGDFILVQVYVDDIIYGLSNRQLCRVFEALMHEKFQMSVMGELNFFLGLQVLQKKDGIFLSQDKYVGDILKKFRYSDVRSSNTPMDKENPLGKDRTEKDVDLHLYRSMIGSLMYLTASRPDIMFAVCAYARHQVTPKESPFDLVAYLDSDYGGATQDRKSTTRGCQFLGRRLISWKCKKQTIVATSTTEAEYVAAASYCGQVLWI